MPLNLGSAMQESPHSANRNTEDRLESVADRAWSKRLNSVEDVSG